MDTVNTTVILERLDGDTAIFCGGDVSSVEQQTMLGPITISGRFPIVSLSKDAWMDMGCPTTMNLTLSEYVVSDSPGL
jgi:hypothetical protein